MDFITASVLGLVEGVTEFLPISSTGHLIIVNQWLSFGRPFTEMFDVVIQLGAVLAALVYFWPKLWPFARGEGGRARVKKESLDIWKKAAIGVIPAVILGALFGSKIQEKLFNPLVVSIALVIGGILIVILENRKKNVTIASMSELSSKKAFSIGLIQCLALIPGTSRSAATILGALFLGASRPVAAEFSFFLAIPTMLAASGYSLLKHMTVITSHETILLLVGFILAFLSGFAVIRVFMKFIQSHDFKGFGYYRIVLGIIILIFFFR